jgi:hypothetical protein
MHGERNTVQNALRTERFYNLIELYHGTDYLKTVAAARESTTPKMRVHHAPCTPHSCFSSLQTSYFSEVEMGCAAGVM